MADQALAGNAAPPASAAPDASVRERMLIRTGELTLEVASADEASAEAQRYVKSIGGYVSNTSSYNEPTSPELRLSLTLRLPNPRYDSAIAHLSARARYVRSQSTNTEDVTEEFVDVEARLKARRALEARYLQLLAQASRIEDLAALEEKLAAVRGEIESMQGRLKYLGNQVAFSTLTLTLVELRPAGHSPGQSFGQQLAEAFAESFRILKSFLLTLVRILPSLLIGGAVALLLARLARRWWRGRKRG
jgi:hypothetical protein